MKMNYKHLGLYVLAGIVSGSLSSAVAVIVFSGLIEATWVAVTIIMTVTIYTAGRYVSDTDLRNTWFSPVALLVTCFAGLFLAFRLIASCIVIFGRSNCVFGEFWGIVVSGGIVGICVAIGVALAWKLDRVGLVIAITTVAGLLGGLAGQIVWEFTSFIVWQAILLLGIGIAVQIDSAKSSTEQ